MSRILVWDLPTRVFHALLIVGVVACFSIAQLAGEHSSWFPVHMLLGIVLGATLVLRVVWGLVGTRYARFSSLMLRPSGLLQYLKTALAAKGPRYTAHNPGSSYSIVAMLLLVGIVIGTGLMTSNGSEAAEEIHTVAAYSLAALAAVHVLGVVWYTVRHRENISRSMITGYREGEPDEAIPSSRPGVAVVFVMLTALVAVSLFRNYDAANRETKLPLIGTVVHLGEAEHH